MKEIIKKIMICEKKVCPFGCKKIDEKCNICRYLKEIFYSSEIRPIFIEIEKEIEFNCYKNDRLPLHQECLFDIKEYSEKCRGCVRLQEKIIKSETKEI